MKQPTTTPRIPSKEAYATLTRPRVHVFVDGNDLGVSLPDVEALNYVTENVDRSVRCLTHYCRTFGHVQEAYVFDDDWSLIKKSFWSNEGFTNIDVEKETTSDTRVAMVLSLRVFQTAVRLSGNAVFVLIVGGLNYQELIEEVKCKGFKIVVIGIDEYQTDRVKRSADLWVPFQQVIPNLQRKKDSGVRSYDWTAFVQLIHSMENSSLDFVGVKHLIRNVLPSIGLSDLSEAHTVVEQAEAKGIIEMYKVKNPNGPYPVQACKLVEENNIVRHIIKDAAPG